MASSATCTADDRDFPGPFCRAVGIKFVDIQDERFSRTDVVKNGVVLELNRYKNLKNIPQVKLVDWVFRIHPNFPDVNECHVTQVKEKIRLQINQLVKSRDALRRKKSAAKLQDLENAFFLSNFHIAQSSVLTVNDVASTNPCSSDTQDASTAVVIQNAGQAAEDTGPNETCSVTLSDSVVTDTSARGAAQMCSCVKDDHFLSYEISKKEKHLLELKNQLESIKHELKSTEGKYNERNVDRRDERARNNYSLACSLKAKVTSLETINCQLLQTLENTNVEKDKKIAELQEKLRDTEAKLEKEKEKKRSSQLSRSYYKAKGEGKIQDKQDKILKQQLEEKNNEISRLEVAVELGDGQETPALCLKDDSGFSSQMRFCVLGLLGLEIAQAKITPVVQWVLDSLFGMELAKDQLPSRTSVQKISDESHYIAKRFIAHELDKCQNWGLAKDGTSRKKAKLLDTSLTLSSGDCMSLGFTRVARETGAAIVEVAQSALKELEDVHKDGVENSDSQNFLVGALEKLSFTMGDRASNEKCAHRILDEWREQVLKDNSSPAAEKNLHAFHCMAHVVLGFHAYAKKSLTDFENDLAGEFGRFGRDSLPRFAFWKKEEAASRAVRTIADLFGPVGEHLGVRDQWESYCANRGIKSTIQNYRDNRFNNYFEIAAQICHHREDFIKVLEKGEGKDPNGKKVAVLADLKCPIVTTILQGLGLMFVLITGPYWQLTESGTISYLELYKYIQPAYKFLRECSEDPGPLLVGISPFPEEFRVSTAALHQSVSVLKHDDQEEVFLTVLKKCAAAFVQTMDAQLKDFLEDGKYSQEPDPVELERTRFSGVTNLPCEHHFGDLDSSQRRRPSATLFYHSTVQILKRNRKQIINWIKGMTEEEHNKLWADARQKGKQLRDKHKMQEKTEMEKIFQDMNKAPPAKRQRKRKKAAEEDNDDDINEPNVETTHARMEERRQQLKDQIAELEKDVNIGKWVVVAFQEDWYPGIVRDHGKSPSEWFVDFGKRCDTGLGGEFLWPDGKDKQIIEAVFIIAVGFNPSSKKRGRHFVYEVPNVDSVIGMYNEYASLFFDEE